MLLSCCGKVSTTKRESEDCPYNTRIGMLEITGLNVVLSFQSGFIGSTARCSRSNSTSKALPLFVIRECTKLRLVSDSRAMSRM